VSNVFEAEDFGNELEDDGGVQAGDGAVVVDVSVGIASERVKKARM